MAKFSVRFTRQTTEETDYEVEAATAKEAEDVARKRIQADSDLLLVEWDRTDWDAAIVKDVLPLTERAT